MYSAVIGIDVGLSGGIAIMRSPDTVDVIHLPATEGSIDISALKHWVNKKTMNDPYIGGLHVIAYMEAIHSMRGQGVVSTCTFCRIAGLLEGFIRTMEIPLKLVTPQAWKKDILAGTAKDKQAAIDYCLRVYPNVKLIATDRSRTYHSGMADALCIAEYGYRKENNV